jgi:hypothetical protein
MEVLQTENKLRQRKKKVQELEVSVVKLQLTKKLLREALGESPFATKSIEQIDAAIYQIKSDIKDLA